jgi:KDO2-lipid IV(A) lauroyltransferase
MNQDTPVVLGPEKIARKYEMAVVFYKVSRVSRGHYEAELSLLEENAASTKPAEVTEKYYRILEQHINNHPEYYLWTHNRWKHKRDGGFSGS